MKRIKELNIPVAKPLVDIHLNICHHMKKQSTLLNTKQCHTLEQLINQAESTDDVKAIISLLETKMVKQTKIETILRLLCLFSVTQSGFK